MEQRVTAGMWVACLGRLSLKSDYSSRGFNKVKRATCQHLGEKQFGQRHQQARRSQDGHRFGMSEGEDKAVWWSAATGNVIDAGHEGAGPYGHCWGLGFDWVRWLRSQQGFEQGRYSPRDHVRSRECKGSGVPSLPLSPG